MIIPVILSGGSGTRLWPLSRTKLPKQFCQIFEQSLQEMTLRRMSRLSTPWIVTGVALRELTLRQASHLGIPEKQIFFEPQSRNTAPAIAWICRLLQLRGLAEAIVGVFPSDHLIENETEYFAALSLAEEEARRGRIVTLGVQPSWPATGYGYIQLVPSDHSRRGRFSARSVRHFHEKPDAPTARRFLESGDFFWNAGIFVFKVERMIEAFRAHQPELWTNFEGLREDLSNLDEVFASATNISIDYAILEKLSEADLSCIPCDVGWNDIGSWDAIVEVMEHSPTEIIQAGASGNFVHGLKDRVYAITGVDDLIVVDTKDALLIAKKGKSQGVKDLVEQLKLRQHRVIDEPPPGGTGLGGAGSTETAR